MNTLYTYSSLKVRQGNVCVEPNLTDQIFLSVICKQGMSPLFGFITHKSDEARGTIWTLLVGNVCHFLLLLLLLLLFNYYFFHIGFFLPLIFAFEKLNIIFKNCFGMIISPLQILYQGSRIYCQTRLQNIMLIAFHLF